MAGLTEPMTESWPLRAPSRMAAAFDAHQAGPWSP